MVVLIPKLQTVLFGWPDIIRLTDAEVKAMEAVHLGGLEALRTKTYKCSCRTINSLIGKGLLAGNGPTDLGRAVAKSVAETKLNAVIS